MIQITHPSLVFSPWNKVKQPGVLAGSGMDLNLPIYWSEVPAETELDHNTLRSLSDEDMNNEHTPYEIIEHFYTAQKPIILLGAEEVLLHVMAMLQRPEVQSTSPVRFAIHYTGSGKFKNSIRYFFQPVPDSGQMRTIRYKSCIKMW